MSPSLHKCQCVQLWNSENTERKRNHTLQCGCFKHRTLVPNHSFRESAQYLRSSFELVWAIRFDRGRKGTRQNSRQRGVREQRDTKERELTRSEPFGFFSKTSIWKQFAGKHSGLRTTVRDFSVHKGLRSCFVLVRGIVWYKIQDQTWRGRRFVRNHSIMPWIHAFASKPTIQSICSNSWRNNCWTSHWSSHRKSSWQLWTWNRSSISTWSNTDIFCSVFASLRGRIAYPKCQIYWSLNMQNANESEPCLAQSKTSIQETGANLCCKSF